MDFKTAFVTCAIEKKFNWKDRASRSEFWWFYLATILIGIVSSFFNAIPILGQVIALVINVAIWWLTTVAAIRRLHDTDKSGFWLLLPTGATILGVILVASAIMADTGALFWLGILVALAGSIYLLVLLVKPGTPGTNKFGPNPLGLAAVAPQAAAPAAQAAPAQDPAAAAQDPAAPAQDAAAQQNQNGQQ